MVGLLPSLVVACWAAAPHGALFKSSHTCTDSGVMHYVPSLHGAIAPDHPRCAATPCVVPPTQPLAAGREAMNFCHKQRKQTAHNTCIPCLMLWFFGSLTP